MPPEINFGQPQKLSHTTESPWEQAALIENSVDLRSKSAVSTNYDGRSRPQLPQLVSSKITMAYECVILADCPGALIELCGISTLERLLRTLQRCGIERATILSSTSERIAEELARKVTRSPGRFSCAVETSTAGGSGPKRTGREILWCGTAATRLGFDPERSSRKRD